MIKTCFLLAVALLSSGLALLAADAEKAKDTRCFEMRIYYAPPGKLDELHARFRDHTVALFKKHGIENIGYFVPMENPDNKLVYLLAYPSKEARDKAWKEFMGDPEWQKAAKASEANGPLVIGSKLQSIFLSPTDYSPVVAPTADAAGRVFELRTYTASEGKLDDLNARFRNHTLKLFEKHGMKNIGYWTKMPGQKEADKTLIYLLSHKSKEAAKASFDAFRQDPEWVSAKTESEKNGPLTIKDGVKSEFLVPTDYSPMK